MTITHARVTNGNDFPITDRYDGIPITFEPGVPKTISMEAAALFFDMPVDYEGVVTFAPDLAAFARRHGWTNMERLKDEPMNEMVRRVTSDSAAKCKLIKVEPVSMRLREVVAEEEELEPPREDVTIHEAEAPKPRRGKAAVT